MAEETALLAYMKSLDSQLQGVNNKLGLLTEVLDRLSKTEEKSITLFKQIITLQEQLSEVEEDVEELQRGLQTLQLERLAYTPLKKLLSVIFITAISVSVTLMVTDIYGKWKAPASQLGHSPSQKETKDDKWNSGS